MAKRPVPAVAVPPTIARATSYVQRQVHAEPAFAAACYAIERTLLDALDAREAA